MVPLVRAPIYIFTHMAERSEATLSNRMSYYRSYVNLQNRKYKDKNKIIIKHTGSNL